jgi:hypothetical protein
MSGLRDVAFFSVVEFATVDGILPARRADAAKFFRPRSVPDTLALSGIVPDDDRIPPRGFKRAKVRTCVLQQTRTASPHADY